AGAWNAAGGIGAVVRDHALGAVGAADDQPELADDDDCRRRVSHQHVRRLRGGQCAMPAVAHPGGGRRVVLPAARRRQGGKELSAGSLRAGSPSSLRTLLRAVVLALFAFAIFGPLLNLLLWAFAER